MTNPNEPTLTCSEVVERLLAAAEATDWAILHSWRERRVQELEEALRSIVNERYTELDMMWCDYQPDTMPFDAWHDGVSAAWKQFDIVKKIAKDALANSEWREQIRKGAKHE
jgi:hypothetical protein